MQGKATEKLQYWLQKKQNKNKKQNKIKTSNKIAFEKKNLS